MGIIPANQKVTVSSCTHVVRVAKWYCTHCEYALCYYLFTATVTMEDRAEVGTNQMGCIARVAKDLWQRKQTSSGFTFGLGSFTDLALVQ